MSCHQLTPGSCTLAVPCCDTFKQIGLSLRPAFHPQTHPGIDLQFFLAQPPDADAAAHWLPALQVHEHACIMRVLGGVLPSATCGVHLICCMPPTSLATLCLPTLLHSNQHLTNRPSWRGTTTPWYCGARTLTRTCPTRRCACCATAWRTRQVGGRGWACLPYGLRRSTEGWVNTSSLADLQICLQPCFMGKLPWRFAMCAKAAHAAAAACAP